jgi:nucleotide-binding universal stress UspA family protein
MKLLVAIDYSQPSQQVLNEAARRTWPDATISCVLHVVDWSQLPANVALIDAMKRSAEALVKSASEKLCKAGVQSTGKVLEGHSRVAIAEYARQWGADLILIGAHGAGGLVRFLLGSVAQATLRRSTCSVEIVRRPAEDSAAVSSPMKILVGVDGSECSMVAVRSVARRPWPAGSQIRLISVVPLIVTLSETIPPAPVYYPPPEVTDTLQKEVRGQAEEAVARARQVLTEASIKPVQIESLPVGDPKEVILDQAKNWNADLIAVGSHGYRGIDRLMLGSVSEAVAMHAHCSVEVIRESSLTTSKESS